jgi:superfamily II DNA or RNA helicase
MIEFHLYRDRCVLDGNGVSNVIGVLDRHFSYEPKSARHQKEHLRRNLRDKRVSDERIKTIMENFNSRVSLVNREDASFPPGLMYSAIKILLSKNEDCKIIDHIDVPKHKQYNWQPPKGFEPRKHQVNGIKVSNEVMDTCHFMLSRMATGAGKTFDACMTIAHYGLPAMFVVPSKLLLEQAYEDFIYFFGENNVGRLGSGYDEDAPIQIATLQTLSTIFQKRTSKDVKNKRLNYIRSKGIFIADEVHRLPADQFYPLVWEFEAASYFKGYTATDRRKDGGTLKIEAASGYTHYSVLAPDLINSGHLVPPLIQFERMSMRVPPRFSSPEEAKAFYLDANKFVRYQITENNASINKIARLAKEELDSGRHVLLSINKTEHGKAIQEAIGDGDLVHSKISKPWKRIKDFRDGKHRLLISTLCNEGFNAPVVDSVIIAQDTTDTEQIVGRGLRLSDNKDACRVLHTYHHIPNEDRYRFARWLTKHAIECREIYTGLQFPILKDIEQDHTVNRWGQYANNTET